MTNKQKKWEDIISLVIDEKTQEAILQNPKLAKTIRKVSEAVWGMQDKIDEAIKNQD